MKLTEKTVLILAVILFSVGVIAGVLPISRGGTGSSAGHMTIPAGSTLAGGANFYITSGSTLATPANGAVESNGVHLWWTNDSGVRKQLDP